MFRILKQPLLIMFLASNLFAQQNIEIKVLRGSAIIPYVKAITQLCLAGYREYPHLYEGTADEYGPHIKSYAQSKQGIVCLLFENKKPIGFIAGMPLQYMRSNYKKPWLEKTNEDITSLFYIGELVVLKEYQKKGYGKDLFHAIEPHIKKLKNIKKICCCRIVESDNCPQTNHQYYISLDKGFADHGFVRLDELNFTVNWRNVGESKDSPHTLTYWIKSLHK